MSFDLTDDMEDRIAQASTILSEISLVMCFFILGSAAAIYAKSSTRHYLDRISFRLMLWTMFFEIGYDVCYIYLAYMVPGGASCQIWIYFQLATLAVVNYLCTCIAINLMLSISFSVDTVRHHLERWYIGGSIALGLGITIVPAALGHFGQDPLYNSCYFKDDNVKIRLIRFGVDLYLWQGLSTLISCGAVIVTLVTLFRHGRATAKALFGAIVPSGDIASDPSHEGPCRSKYSVLTRLTTLFRRRRVVGTMNRLQDKFSNIALKISLYPVVLIVVNTVLTVGDMYLSSQDGVSTRAEYVLYVMYYFLYGGKGVFFALLAIFVDPCLFRGLKALWRSRRGRSNPRQNAHRPHQSQPQGATSQTPVLGYPSRFTDYTLNSDVDILSALASSSPDVDGTISVSIPGVTTSAKAPIPGDEKEVEDGRYQGDSKPPSQPGLIKSFDGVRSSPSELADDDSLDIGAADLMYTMNRHQQGETRRHYNPDTAAYDVEQGHRAEEETNDDDREKEDQDLGPVAVTPRRLSQRTPEQVAAREKKKQDRLKEQEVERVFAAAVVRL